MWFLKACYLVSVYPNIHKLGRITNLDVTCLVTELYTHSALVLYSILKWPIGFLITGACVDNNKHVIDNRLTRAGTCWHALRISFSSLALMKGLLPKVSTASKHTSKYVVCIEFLVQPHNSSQWLQNLTRLCYDALGEYVEVLGAIVRQWCSERDSGQVNADFKLCGS